MANKSIAKNSIYNVVYKGLTTVFPLITTAYVSRALLPDGLGNVTYSMTIVTYFALIASLGIPNYGIRVIAQQSNDIQKRSIAFFELFLLNALSTVICIVAYYVFINEFSYFESRKILFNIVGLRLILNLLNLDWFFQGIEEYKIISTRGITVRVISFVLILIFVHEPSDYLKYALILCLGIAGNNIYNAFLLPRFIQFPKTKIVMTRHLVPVLFLLASTIATEIYTMLDTVIIEYYHEAANVAYYSNAVKIVRTVYNITIAIAAPLYPRISMYIQNQELEKSNKLLNDGSKIIYMIAFPAAVGIIMLSNYIAPMLFGNAYMPSAGVLKILGVLIIVFSSAYLFGHIILLAAGKEKEILYATIAGAIINFSINMLLIPSLKQEGAAIASLCAEIVVTIILVFYARHYYSLSIGKEYTLSIVFSLTLMAITIMVGKYFLDYSVLNTIIIIISAMIVYFVGLIISKNESIKFLVRKVK